jgi:hypothetical protein
MTLVQLAKLFGVHTKTNHRAQKRGAEHPRQELTIERNLTERALSKAAAENAGPGTRSGQSLGRSRYLTSPAAASTISAPVLTY